MASKREKFGLISLGIFLGLVISVSLFWWDQSILNTQWISFPKFKSFVQELFDRNDDFLTQKDTSGSQKPDIASKNKVKLSGINSGNDSLSLNDSVDMSFFQESGAMDYYIESNPTSDSLDLLFSQAPRKGNIADSLRNDSLLRAQRFALSGEIKVKRDQFIISKNYKVSGLADSTSATAALLDSVLTNDRYSRHLKGNVFRIEFWRSPVNFTGYKMEANKIVLFGNFVPEEVSLEYRDRSIFLRYRNTWYRLEYTPNFQSLNNHKKPERN